MDKRIKILLCVIAVALVVTIVTTSYAFFTIANKEGEESVITSGTMGLHLEDGPEVGLNAALPGASVTKTFYVENTGNVDTAYDIYLSEVVNTFADKTDLVYTLTSNDGGYSTTGQVEVPSTSAKIVDSKTIPVSGIHHYTLTITFLNKNENQDDNQGKEFSGKIQINEYTNANGGGVDPIDPDPINPPSPIRIVSGDIDTVGSEVCIDEDCFFVIGKENGNPKLLAKNLLDANDRQTSNEEDALYVEFGAVSQTKPGVSKYTNLGNDNGYEANVYYAYDPTSGDLAAHLENYVSYLRTSGHQLSGRLISMEEVDGLGCPLANYCYGGDGCGYCLDEDNTYVDVIRHLNPYWTGSVKDDHGFLDVFVIDRSGGEDYVSREPDSLYGIRPVIILES